MKKIINNIIKFISRHTEYYDGLCAGVTACTVACKLDNLINWHWAIVLIPIWALIAGYLISYLIRRKYSGIANRYVYFVSFIGINEKGYLTGNCEFEANKEVSTIADYRFIESRIIERHDLKSATVMNCNLLRTENI